MREILFRGKRCDNGEWVEGSLWLHGGIARIFDIGDFPDGCDWVEVAPATLGQYTGLKDKNGNRIFEGDILRFAYEGKNRGVSGTEVVIFESGKFGVRWGWHRDLVALDGFANTSIEIIGNIHDNPGWRKKWLTR